jgi:hypothetical protein
MLSSLSSVFWFGIKVFFFRSSLLLHLNNKTSPFQPTHFNLPISEIFQLVTSNFVCRLIYVTKCMTKQIAFGTRGHICPFRIYNKLSDQIYFGRSKGKFVSVLNWISTTPRRLLCGGCIDPYFLDLGTSWRWVVSFTPRPLYPRGKSSQYPLDMRMGGPQSRSGQREDEKNLDPTGTRIPTPWSSST